MRSCKQSSQMQPVLHSLYSLAIQMFIFLVLSCTTGSWQDWPEATCFSRSSCYCEHVREESLVRQCFNTWTSFSFHVCGIFIQWASQNHFLERIAKFGPLLAASLDFLGFSEAFFHSSLTLTGEMLCTIASSLVLSWIIAFNVIRLPGSRNCSLLFVILWMEQVLFFKLAYYLLPQLHKLILVMALVLALVSQVFCDKQIQSYIKYWYLWLAIGCFVVASAVSEVLCTRWLPGHSLSHICYALGIFSWYYLFHTENNKTSQS